MALASTSSAPCTSNYHAGVQSVDMTIENTTGQVLTLDSGTPAGPTSGTGARSRRPPAAGACEELTGYSDSPLGDFYLTATYRLPDGTYIPFSVDSGTDDYNGIAFTEQRDERGEHRRHVGPAGLRLEHQQPDPQRDLHVHYTLVAHPAPTPS